MNLIDKLGGYNNAKSVVDRAPDSTFIYHNHPYHKGYVRCFFDDGEEYFLVSNIEKELLEYRRQYKIYQVGDKVVRIDGQDVVFEVAGGCIGGDTCNPDRNGIVYTDYIAMTKGLPHHRSKLRHATDAEAKVGKRSDE